MAALTFKVGGDTTGLGRAVSKAKGMLSGLGTAAKNLALGGAVAGSVAAIGSAFRGLKLAAEMEQVSVAMEVMTGSAEKGNRAIEALMEFSNSTPLKPDEVVSAGRALIAFGTEADEVVDVLKKVGNVASGIGAPLGEIAEIYGKAQVSGRLFGEDINQMAGRGIPIQKELAKVLGVSTSSIKEMVSDGKVGFPELEKAFTNMSSSGGKFAGMLDKQSKTFSGLLSTLIGKLNDLVRNVGKGLMESLKPVLNALINLVDENSEAAKRFGENIKDAVFVIMEAFKTGVLGELLKSSFLFGASFLVNAVVQGFATAGQILMKAAVGVGEIIGGIFSNSKMQAFLKTMKLGAFQTVFPDIPSIPNLLGREALEQKEKDLINDVMDAFDRVEGGEEAIFSDFKKFPTLMDSEKHRKNLQDTIKPLLDAVREREKNSSQVDRPDITDVGNPSRASLFGLDKKEEEKKKEQDRFSFKLLKPIVSSLGRIGGDGARGQSVIFRMDKERNKLLKDIAFNTGNGQTAVFG
jgi:tape measure domain-containing protein